MKKNVKLFLLVVVGVFVARALIDGICLYFYGSTVSTMLADLLKNMFG